jgi:hypothetical protein
MELLEKYLADCDDNTESEEELAVVDSDAESAQVARDHSPLSACDLIRWAYEVKRKTWYHNDQNEDEIPFVVVGERSYDTKVEANEVASEEIYCVHEDHWYNPGSHGFLLEPVDGMIRQKFWDAERTTSIIVDRFLLGADNSVMPQSKREWLPRYIYAIKEVVESEPSSDTDSEGQIADFGREHAALRDSDEYFTLLSDANRAAAEYVLKRHVNATQTYKMDDVLWRKEQEKRLWDLLEKAEAQSEPLRWEGQYRSREGTILVYVKKGEVKGPRN